MTIRRRLLLLLLPALTVLMISGALVDRWLAAATTESAYDQALAATAFAAAAYVEVGDGAVRFGATPRTIAFLRGDGTLRPAGDARFYAVRGPRGRLLAGNADLPQLSGNARVGEPLFGNARYRGRAVRLVSVWVPTPAGRTTVTVAETRTRRSQARRVALFGKLLVDFAELDVTLLLIWFAVSLGLAPLGRVRAAAEAYSRRELTRFEERHVPGELRPLITAFNRVLELLHEAAAAQRRFVADAAHQLRTPVAGLAAQLELLATEARAAPLGGELAALQRGVQSLAHTANQLLALARADVSALDENFAPVALDAVVRELVERHLARADRAVIDLGAEAQPAVTRGEAWLLEDLLGNLIDNALKYTPRGGRVTVRSGTDQGRPFLEVEDDGPGIPEEERRRVRERFYRRPGSPGIGVGLGLAIVEEIARLHGASFLIGSGAQGRGARMRVLFAAGEP